MLKLKEGVQKVEVLSAKQEPKWSFVQKVIGGDTYLVMAQSAVEIEDEFSSLYFTASSQSNLFLMPPFEPNVLTNLTQINNVLNQCIEAMEVNIDGTGHSFIAKEDGDEVDEIEKKKAEAFFNEPYPGQSFVNIRRKLRRQMEAVGYSFLEVLRNIGGDIVGVRNVETQHIRFVKLDKPIQVKKTVIRDGKEVELTMWERERRFAQMVALKQQVFYREFGTTRQVNRDTGEWESKEKPIPPENRGTELLIFGIHPDNITPYYLPRWINQLPSVIGSRKAEEQNLQFFDSGGLPPAIIFVQGGTLAKDASDQLRMYLSGKNQNKYRAVVVEAQASGGSLENAGNVQVKVERFGAQSAQDSMYQKYDAAAEEHVRVGFRLPPLFIGRSQDYSFATAAISYQVAEAQVFLPERDEFDEIMNRTILPGVGFKSLKFKSNPITLKDVTSILKGLELSKDVATRESFVKEINSTTGMDIQMSAVPQPNIADGEAHPGAPTVAEIEDKDLPASMKPPAITSPQPKPAEKPLEKSLHETEMEKLKLEEQRLKNKQLARTPKKATEIIELAHNYAAMKGLVQKRELSVDQQLIVKEDVAGLNEEEREAFDSLLSTYVFGADSEDLVSIVGHAHQHIM